MAKAKKKCKVLDALGYIPFVAWGVFLTVLPIWLTVLMLRGIF